MFAEFIHYYNYTSAQALDENAKTFFGLVNQMFRIKARERIDDIMTVSAGMAGKEGKSIIEHYKKQADGQHKILEEVRSVRGKH